MQRHHLKRIAVSVALGTLVVACSSSDDATPATTPSEDSTTDATPPVDSTTGSIAPDDTASSNEPEPVAGFDGTTIKIGALSVQAGPVAAIAQQFTSGQRAYFEYINAELGGIAGQYPLELVERDTGYDPSQAAQQYAAVKGDVVMFGHIIGTGIISSLLPQITADGIVAVPGSFDAAWIREPNLLPVGAPYQIQGANALSYLVDEGGYADAPVCAAGHDDPFGEAGLEGFRFAADEVGVEIVHEARFPATETDFTATVQALQAQGCEAVFLAALPNTAPGLLGRAAALGFDPTWIAVSAAYLEPAFAGDLAAYAGEHFLTVLDGPAWGDDSVPGMTEMLAVVAEYAPDQAPDPLFVQGYAMSMAVVDVLEAAVANGDLSREGIQAAMDGLPVLDFEGLSGEYAWGLSTDRVPPRINFIAEYDPTAPGGLSVVTPIESDAALAYSFD